MRTNRTLVSSFALLGATLILSGCHTDMWRQPKIGAQQESTFFSDGMGDRKPVEGTVRFNGLVQDELRTTGRVNGKMAKTMPEFLMINGEKLSTKTDIEKIIRRGKERYEIFCTHCHGALGAGDGMITKRGLELRRKPGNYHTDRLRKMPIGHFFDVITNGYGVMYPFGYRVENDDRWAIASYIRVLQASQNASVNDVPSDRQNELEQPSKDLQGAEPR